MTDDSKHGKSQEESDEEESPEIYAIADADHQPTFSRRSFLEIAAVAAGTAAISSLRPTEAAAGKENASLVRAHDSEVTALAVNSKGSLLASGDKKGSLKLWELPNGELLHSWTCHIGPILTISFSQADDALWSLDSKGLLKHLRVPDGKEIKDGNFSRTVLGDNSLCSVPGENVWYAAARNDYITQTQKKLLELGVSLEPTGIVELRTKASNVKLFVLKDWNEKISAITSTLDGHLLMAGGINGELALWTDPISNPYPLKVYTGRAAISALTIDPKSTMALSAHADGQIINWKLSGFEQPKSYKSENGKPFSLTVRPQLDLFALGSEKPRIELFSLKKAAMEPLKLNGHKAAVRATAITPDGSLLISGSEDKTIRLWSLPDGKYLRSLVDLKANYENVKGLSYEVRDVYGRTIRYTQPCGTPIPPGAICTCNCVPGFMSIPKNHSRIFNSEGYCTCDLYCTCHTVCTCNTVCTCQSVGTGSSRGGGYYTTYWYPN